MIRRAVVWAVAGGLWVLTAISAIADDPTALRHEYLPDVGDDEAAWVVAAGGEEPAAIVYQGEVLPPPPAEGLQPGEPPMLQGAGDGAEREEAGRRSPTFRPDRITELSGEVDYYTVFTPSIAPFKRVTALDRVTLDENEVPILSIRPGAVHTVGVIGIGTSATDGGVRDRFWGSVVIDFAEGPRVPFPSVSPDARLLTLRTEPSTQLRFVRDGADNYFAEVLGPSPTEPVRAIFLTDAPRAYFGRERLPDAPVDALLANFEAPPASVQRDALRFAAELGLSRRSRFDRALTVLVRHFRSFEESSEPPANSGNIYLDLARGRRGICRHRAYAFVITAHALGIHARFVQNEAHAWVEVELPVGDSQPRWLRIDLGGAATGLNSRGPEGPRYAPPLNDILPRPPEYEAAYEQARRMSEMGGGSNGGSGDGEGVAGDPEPGGEAGDPQGNGQPSNDPSAPEEGSTGATDADRTPTSIVLDNREFEVLRGRQLEITGLVRGQDPSGLRIEVLLRPSRGLSERMLGVTVTREQGRFRGVFGVPPDLPVGDYRLIVRTPGNERLSGSTAR